MTLAGSSPLPESRLDPVQVLNLADEPAAELGRLVAGLTELPAHVGPAAASTTGWGRFRAINALVP